METEKSLNLKCGDIVLFSGNDPVHKRVQEILSHRWSQVSLVIEWGIERRKALFESTKLPLTKDICTGDFQKGVHIVSFEEKLQAFHGVVAVRKLNSVLSTEQKRRLLKFIINSKGLPFNDSRFFMIRIMYRANTENTASYICSQLVANHYK